MLAFVVGNLCLLAVIKQIDIQSIQQELTYWNEKSQAASSKSDKEAANAFSMAVEKLNGLLRLFN